MNKDDVLHLAKLARLELSEEEIQAFPGQIDDILQFVGQIKDAELPEGVVRDMQNYNTLRDDVVVPSDTRDAIINAFPHSEQDMLQVSKILPN